MHPELTTAEPWLIEPLRLDEMRECLAKEPIANRVDARGRPGRDDEDDDGLDYSVVGGVATLGIRGVMLKSVPWWMSYFGMSAVSTPAIAAAVREAAADPNVKRIVLRIDSPGGQVSGVEDAGNAIREAGAAKPVTAVVEDMAASAAYWLASQASDIVVAPGGSVGSIGVYMVSVDSSRLYDKMGISVKVHRAGELKGAGTPGTPLTDAQAAYFDEEVREIAADFVKAVASGRGLDANNADQLATGRMWRAQRAKTMGLVDRVESIPSALQSIATAVKEARMADEHEINAATESGATIERDRMRSIRALFPDDPDFALKHIDLGSSTAEASEAYVPFLREKEAKRREQLEAENAQLRTQRGAPPPPAGTSPAPLPYGGSAGGSTEELDFIGAAKAHKKEHGGTIRDAMSYVALHQPELHRAFVDKANEKRVKLEKDGTPRIKGNTRFEDARNVLS